MNEKALKEIEIYFLKKYPQVGVLDGIIQLDEYKKAEPKILWILKDPNAMREGQTIPDYQDLREALNICVKNNNLAGFAKTYSKLMKVSYMILKRHNENLICDCKSVISKLAIINVKKCAGIAKVTGTEIHSYYKADRDLIHQQIEAIDPDIIINTSKVESILNKGALNVLDRQYVNPFMIGIQKTENKKRLVLNVYHPGCHMSEGKYIGLVKQCFDKLKERSL